MHTQRSIVRGSLTALASALLLSGLLLAGCSRADSPPKAPQSPWWRQDTAVTWSGFGNPAHRKWLGFVREVGTTACDRGIFYAHDTPPGTGAPAAAYYHQQGLRVTSFLSIDQWKTDDASVEELIAKMRRQLDDGCDGIHLDMLFSPAGPRDAPAAYRLAGAIARLRDAVHAYPRKPRAMFAGNVWLLDTPVCLLTAKLCDVAWIESWGHDDLRLVRAARVARSLDHYRKPAWYHWQPADNEQDRVAKLRNLPRALYASCLAEGAVFLCNYQYPVPLVHRNPAGQKITQWKMLPINDAWQKAVVAYARFAKQHGELLRDSTPAAPVLVAFRPRNVGPANRIMRRLLETNIAFNVRVSGPEPLKPLTAEDLADYKAVVTPDVPWAKRLAASTPLYASAAKLLAAAGPEIRDVGRVQPPGKVVTRIYTKGTKTLVHLKQYGYTDAADKLPTLGPLTLSLPCPQKVRTVTCLSPDRPGHTNLSFQQQAPHLTITVPSLDYHNLLIIDREK